MIKPISIADQGIGHATEVEQAIPVGIIARQTGDFQTQNHPDMTQGDFGGQLDKAGTLCRTGAGKAEILVDDDDLIARPAERYGAVDQRVLTSGRLPVVLCERRREFRLKWAV